MIGMSVCSGIGAPETAAPWIDWRYQSEIEKFPCAVLKHRFPDAVNLGDMTKFPEWTNAEVDVLCGGTPCQSFSVAGLRKGLADPRGNLTLTYLAIAERYRPRWIVWENVPGVLSSNGGRDFGALVGGLGQLGYGFAYRVLDAQYCRTRRFPFAVPQRRRRVFVVGYLGDWRPAAAVLFDRESLSGNPAPRREAGKAAPTIPSRSSGGGGLGTDFDCDGGLIPAVSPAMKARDHKGVSSDGCGDGLPIIPVAQGVALRGREGGGDKPHVLAFSCKDHGADAMQGVAPTMRAMGHAGSHQNGGGQIAVAHALRGEGFDASEDGTGRGTPIVASSPWAVRRLTPTECERLMGFPENWTQVPYRGKPAADGPRYKALGNSWAVNCGEYVFDRIRAVEAML